MYTSIPCGAPNGSTVLPPGLIAAASSAGAAAAANPGTSIYDAINTAIQNWIAANPQTPVDPNAIPVAQSVGVGAANGVIGDNQVASANRIWYRLIARKPWDFAGMRINPNQFIQPEANVFQNWNTQGTSARSMAARRASQLCNPRGGGPQIIPIQAGFIPPAANPIPMTAPPVVRPAPIPATPQQPPANCRTGNICIDLRNGCVLSSQVDPAQLLACAQAGYTGNLNKYPAIAAAGGAPGGPFGTPMPNPPPYNAGMGAVRRPRWIRPVRRIA